MTGVDVDWTSVLGEAGPDHVELPTYAFQHRTFWPRPAERDEAPTNADPVDSAFWEAVEQENLDGLADTLGLGTPALAEVLPALAGWRRTRREATALDSWRYRVTWRPLTDRQSGQQSGRNSDRPSFQLDGNWLLLASDASDPQWSGAIGRALDASGAHLVTVEVDPATLTRENFAAQLGRHLSEAGRIDGVLSLLGVDEQPHPAHPAMSTGLAATLLLTQAMADAALDAPLWLATREAVLATPVDRLSGLRQGQIWGLGRVIGLEHPDRWGGLIDLPAEIDERAAHRLRQALGGIIGTGGSGGSGGSSGSSSSSSSGSGAGPGEDQIAVREQGLFVRRLVHAPVGDTPPRRDWQPRDTALITGGTGGIGAQVARWLAEAGTEHLVLTSRRGDTAPGAAELRTQLTALGARVTFAACDVADREALTALVSGLRAEGEQIRTVVHAAGVVQATALREMSLGECAEVLSAKALGAAHLDALFDDEPLDAFVLFSSNAGVWGSGGQGAYAAANASSTYSRSHARSVASPRPPSPGVPGAAAEWPRTPGPRNTCAAVASW